MTPFTFLFSLLLCVTSIIVSSVHGAGSTSVSSQIRFLLDEETSLRQRLETRLQTLRQRASGLNNSITPCTCPPPTTPRPARQVAYTGTLQPTMSSLTSASLFNFSSDLINVGDPYDPRHTRFMAPVSGIYGFSLAAHMNPGYWVGMELVMEDKPILYVKTGHYNYGSTHRQVNMGTNFVVVNVTKGAEVWPKYVSGSRYLWGYGVSTFSGVLLHEM